MITVILNPGFVGTESFPVLGLGGITVFISCVYLLNWFAMCTATALLLRSPHFLKRCVAHGCRYSLPDLQEGREAGDTVRASENQTTCRLLL